MYTTCSLKNSGISSNSNMNEIKCEDRLETSVNILEYIRECLHS